MVRHSLIGYGAAALQCIYAIPTSRHLKDEDEEEVEEPSKLPAEHLRDFFIVVVVLAVLVCIIGYFLDRYNHSVRNKIDLVPIVGLVLA